MSDDWPAKVAKWRALSLKRLEHFGELRRTGRWRHYFATEHAFEEAFRKASADVEKWKQLADRSASSNEATTWGLAIGWRATVAASRFCLCGSYVAAEGIQSIFIGSATASAVAAINMQIVAMLMLVLPFLTQL